MMVHEVIYFVVEINETVRVYCHQQYVDGEDIVFGRVLEGMNIVQKLISTQEIDGIKYARPSKAVVVITNCGQLPN